MHASLLDFLTRHSSLVTAPGLQNVSLRVRVDRVAIDLLPARRHQNSRDHSLWQLRRHTWLKTNIDEQIRYVRDSGRTNEIRALKLWRQRQALYCPSYLLELATIHALPTNRGLLDNLHQVLTFLATSFPDTPLPDPANASNLVSGLLPEEQRHRLSHAAQMSLQSFPNIF